MGQITRTTNPTGLKIIDKKNFVVRVAEDPEEGRVFWVDRFDYAEAKLDPGLELSCVAHAGSTEEYFELGSVSNISTDKFSLRGLVLDQPLRFRFIFNSPGEPLLAGYTDGVQALDESGLLGSSLVDIEPADLGGPTWKLVLPDSAGAGEKPNVLVERSLFPNPASAVRHPWFGVLVMPEVMRQIAMRISETPSALDDSETWISKWAPFLIAIGIQPPVEVEEDDIAAKEAWAAEVITAFAKNGTYRIHLAKAHAEMEGERQ